jgi:hypothetical protein
LFDKEFEILMNSDNCDITFACGMFWKYKNICRDKVINYLAKNIKEKNWDLSIHTQDKSLKGDFKKNQVIKDFSVMAHLSLI